MNRWWLPRSLRARLTLWHVAAMVVVLVVYAAAVFTLVRRNVSQALDDRLRGDFRWAAEMAEQRPDGTLTWFDGDARHENSPWLQVWSEDGQALFRTAVATRLPVPASDRLARDPDGRIVSVPTDTVPFRVLSGHATIAGRPVVLQVGASEAAMRQELRELLLVLLLGLPLSVVAAGLGGYWLARGALTPVNRMAERARAITAERLGERLPVDNPADELGRLASVFNATLGRLESSFEQMRRFTSDVSHELRTPLTAIRSVGEIGLREPRDEAAYREIIGSMLEDSHRLSGLVERLLALSRADTGDVKLSPEAIDLGELAENVTTHLAVLAEEKQQSLTI
ncbi:MAG: histidine kinase dimerization/phospho-acceptor domain-containing protein, partial [Vicinamibacteria bacterium]